MSDYRSLNHTKWECKYHVVFIPKCRRKVLYGKIRQHLGAGFPRASQAAGERDHRRPFVPGSCAYDDSDSAQYSVSEVTGYIEGKSAIRVAREFMRPASELQGIPLLGTWILRADSGNR